MLRRLRRGKWKGRESRGKRRIKWMMRWTRYLKEAIVCLGEMRRKEGTFRSDVANSSDDVVGWTRTEVTMYVLICTE